MKINIATAVKYLSIGWLLSATFITGHVIANGSSKVAIVALFIAALIDDCIKDS